MLTGSLPFQAGTALELMLMHVGSPPPAPSSVRPELGEELDAPLLKMLEKAPEARPATLDEAVQAMVHAVGDSTLSSGAVNIAASAALQRMIREVRTQHPRSERFTPGGVQTPIRNAARSSPAQSGVGSMRGGWTRLAFAGAVLLAVAGITAVVIVFRPHDPGTAPSSSTSAAALSAPAPATSASGTAAAPASAPVPPASVALTFDTEPSDAEVLLGERLLGKAPGPFHVPRSDQPVEIRLRAAGFQDETLEVEPKTNRIITIQLKRKAGRSVGPAVSVPKDLEYPY